MGAASPHGVSVDPCVCLCCDRPVYRAHGLLALVLDAAGAEQVVAVVAGYCLADRGEALVLAHALVEDLGEVVAMDPPYRVRAARAAAWRRWALRMGRRRWLDVPTPLDGVRRPVDAPAVRPARSPRR